MKTPNNNIYNLPKKLDANDYQECCDLIIDEANKNDSVASVYLMGGKWCPGISDLDIIVVYKNNIKIQPLKSPWGLSAKAGFIFTHRYLSFEEEDFIKFYYLYPPAISNLRLLWGKDMQLQDPEKELSDKDYKLLLAFILFGVLVNKILLFPRYAKNKKKDVRVIMGELYSLHHSFYVVKLITGKEIGTDFVKQISDLRNTWFEKDENKNVQTLLNLLDNGIDFVFDLVGELDKFLTDKNFINSLNLFFVNKKYRIRFKADWNKHIFLKSFKGRYIKISVPFKRRMIENFYLTLPVSFSYFFLAFANFPGLFSKHIKNSLSGNIKKSLFAEGISQYVQITNSIFERSVEKDGIYKIPFSYGFAYKKERVLIKVFTRIIRWL